MKTRILSLILALAVFGPAAHAEKMDSETQTQVIERLDRILSQMEKSDSSWVPSQLRLADLLAERARLRFMNEVEANCDGCKGSVKDRTRALSIYESILKKTSPETQGTILFQMAHLFEIANQQKKAVELYNSILKDKKARYTRDIIARARTSLADVLFQQGKFKEALALYQTALNDSQTSNKGLIQYRIGWCQFNLDRLNDGIKTLQKLAATPALLTKETPEGIVADAAFQGDVLRDLATFYSRRAVTSKEIREFQKLIPAAQRKELLFFFAGEVDRLGQKQAAAEIYRSYLQTPGLTDEERLDAMMQLAQVNYDKGSSKSIDDFALAAQAFKNTKCSEDQKCIELQKRMKHYVTELHRSKKVKPDLDVLRAYDIYVKTFPNDTEMAILGAQVAVDLKKNEIAARLYHEAARSATDAKMRETALLGQIESAEGSKDAALRELAYRHYLEVNPKGEKSFEVRYQLAQLAYDHKSWASAADQFRTLALDTTGDADLRKKSADLALDCLAIEKRDADVEKWASEFARVFPAARSEFQQIARKAVVNQVAKTTNDAKSSKGDLHEALEKMQTVNLAGASDSEKILHYKNMSVLAEKSDDEKALVASLGGLLAIKSLSSEDREQALARKVGLYEKKLDFKSAYNVALGMKFPKLSAAERELRLGTLADLAGLRPQKHYEAALKKGLRGASELSVRSRLVVLSARPAVELKKQQAYLMRSPQMMSETILLVFARQHSSQGLEPFMKQSALARLPAIQFIKKQGFYPAHLKLDRQISAHQLNVKNDKQMGKTIQERIRLLSASEKSLAEAVRLKDFTAQVMALTTVSRENERFTRDLLSTPMPKGLQAKEQQRYVGMLKEQAKPFLVKAKISSQKLSDFWSNERAISGLLKDLAKARPEVRAYVAQEVRILAALAPNSSMKSRLEDALDESTSIKDLVAARDAVRANPNDPAEIEKLKNLETKIGHPLMSTYLEGRLNQIQKGKVL